MPPPARTGTNASADVSTSTCSNAEQKLVESMILLLEQGTTPWRREWDVNQGSHHCNLISGRRYRGANPVLLTLALHRRDSDLPFWCGYAEAKAHGLAPRRGCTAAYVLRPQLHHGIGRAAAEQAVAEQEPEPATASISGRSWVSYRPLPLFNAVDLVGDGLAALIQTRRQAAIRAARPASERLLAAEAVLRRWPVPVLHAGDQPCYVPAADRIQLPERTAFHSACAYAATWAHEAIHSTGHSSRLNRDPSGAMGAAGERGRAYAREELVAELGAVLLGDRLEIGSDMANHAAYLDGWISLLHDTPKLLLQVLSDARRAADLIAPEPALELSPPP